MQQNTIKWPIAIEYDMSNNDTSHHNINTYTTSWLLIDYLNKIQVSLILIPNFFNIFLVSGEGINIYETFPT